VTKHSEKKESRGIQHSKEKEKSGKRRSCPIHIGMFLSTVGKKGPPEREEKTASAKGGRTKGGGWVEMLTKTS